MSEYLRPLSQVSLKDSAHFGGKAASLGDLLQAGINVPSGFAVSIEAQHDFMGRAYSAEFRAEIDKLFASERLSRVAVRSSAVAEDGTSASWAGQLESYLNIERDGVEEAIRKCWRSVQTVHAREYAKDKQVTDADLSVGVVVQAMVDSEVAGVMFTVNPVTNNREELIIESVFGLGETLVQGIVSPDRYTFNKKREIVTSFSIEIKQKRMSYEDRRNRLLALPVEVGDRATLKESEVVELAKLGNKIERYYGQPRDIEWARYKNTFYIVQSRPITTL